MLRRATLLLIAILLLPASPAWAGTSVGGGTSMTVVHFLQLVLRRMGYSKEQAESCRPTEEQLELHRAARAGQLAGVGRHENSADPCAFAIDHALELEGIQGKGAIVDRRSSVKQAFSPASIASPEADQPAGVRPAN